MKMNAAPTVLYLWFASTSIIATAMATATTSVDDSNVNLKTHLQLKPRYKSANLRSRSLKHDQDRDGQDENNEMVPKTLYWTIGALALLTLTAPLALFAVAALQGLAKLKVYRNDSRGRLQNPDGLTYGLEDISRNEIEAGSNDTTKEKKFTESADEETSVSTSTIDSCLSIINGNSDLDDLESSMPFDNVDHSFAPSLVKKLIDSSSRTPLRVLVIGDSLAVGVGCIEQFEAIEDKPISLTENIKVDGSYNTSPVFPKALARTLSLHFNRPVDWRSAGVVGGDVQDIREFCMDIVKQESARDTATIDVVVVIFGINDLKKFLINLEGGVSQFRRGTEQLISDIQSLAPGALVVIPQIKIRIDVFPLRVFWDGTLAFWERIKRLAANSKSNNSIYLELKDEDILDLLKRRRRSHRMSTNDLSSHLVDLVGEDIYPEGTPIAEHEILSPDNAHPNKRTYAKWAELVGNQLHARIAGNVEQMRRRGRFH